MGNEGPAAPSAAASRLNRRTLDSALARALRGEGNSTLRDHEVRGLTVYVTAGGARFVYEYRFKLPDGRWSGTRRVPLGRLSSDFGLDQARREASRARLAAGEGLDPKAARAVERAANRAASESITVREALDRYQRERAHRWTASTKAAFTTDAATISDAIGDLPMALVERAHLESVVAKHLEAQRLAGFSGVRRGVRLAQTLASLWRLAGSGTRGEPGWNVVQDASIARALPVPGASDLTSRSRVLSLSEIKALWPVLTGDEPAGGAGLQSRRVLALSLSTGLRIGALAGLRLDDVDLDPIAVVGALDGGPTLRIRAADGNKARHRERAAGASLILPLSALSVSILRRAIEARPAAALRSPWIFSTTGRGPLRSDSVSGAWGLLRRAGLAPQDSTAHDLRRSMRSHLSELDHPGDWHLEELLIGHRPAGDPVSRAYDRGRRLARLRPLADTWGSFLSRLVSAPAATVTPLGEAREAQRPEI